MPCEEPILSEWKHHSEEEMIPHVLNIAHLAQHPPIGPNSVPTNAIVHAIHHAMTREERIPTLRMALEAFTHKNTDLHSQEVEEGAVHALILQLGYCLSSITTQNGNIISTTHQTPEEICITLICQCLYQILAFCSSARRISIWQDLGMTELVPLLLQAGTQSWSVLKLFCRLSIAKFNLIRFPGLLENAVCVLQSSSDSGVGLGSVIVTSNVLQALRDLSFQLEPQGKQALWEAQGLTDQLNTMVAKIHDKQESTSQRHKECIATFWWNLALSVKEMQTQSELIHALLQLLQDRSCAKVRQSAIAALGNMLSSEKVHENDSFWNHLLRMALREEDIVCRRRVVRSLRCLLSKTTTIVPRRSSAMYVLVQVAMQDHDTDTRLQALEGLRHIQTFAKVDVWAQGMIGIMESGGDIRVTWIACQMLPEDFEIQQGHYRSDEFWKAASNLIASIPESHATITRILNSIVKNCQYDKILQNPQALSMLAQLLLTEQRPLELVQQLMAVQYDDEGGKQRLAACDELLTSLVTICLSTTQQEEKDAAKSIILELVSEL